MSPTPRQLSHESTEPTVRVPPRGSRIRDLSLEGPERDPQRKPALLSRLGFGRLSDAARAAYRSLRDSLWDFGPTRTLILAGLANFSVAVILAGSGLGTLAALPALIGFGLSLAALVYAGLPPLASHLSKLDRPRWFAMWAVLTVLLAFLGFSSAAVIVVVLFVAGFTATHVFWDLLNRILLDRKRKESQGVAQATANPNPFLLVFAVMAAWSVVASLLMGYLRLHELGSLGISFLAAHIGLVVGLIPLQVHLLREARKPSIARWSLFRPRRLIRDVVFMAVAGAVVGAELSIASGSGVFSGIPTLALVLVLFGYLGVVARQLRSLRGKTKPYHPLILPAFGMLLLFAPMVVLLSGPPDVLTQLYGAAQAAGILTGVTLITLRGLWHEKAERLQERLEGAIRERVTLERAEAVVRDGYERIRSQAVRRTRGTRGETVLVEEEEEEPSHGGGSGSP
ncbi:MAG: MFS transporter [Candidatus Thermoplasmatota archaeon]|nr:MFS transporter [Candidatus Thermoplasmatota archaeon]